MYFAGRQQIRSLLNFVTMFCFLSVSHNFPAMTSTSFLLLCRRAKIFSEKDFSDTFWDICNEHANSFSPNSLAFVVNCIICSKLQHLSSLNIRELTTIALCLQSHYVLDHICSKLFSPATAPHILLILFNSQSPNNQYLLSVFHYLDHVLEIPRCLAITKLYSKCHTYSSKPLVKLCKSRFSQNTLSLSHIKNRLCSICWPTISEK